MIYNFSIYISSRLNNWMISQKNKVIKVRNKSSTKNWTIILSDFFLNYLFANLNSTMDK